MHAVSVQPMHTMEESLRHVTLPGATASPYIAALTNPKPSSSSSFNSSSIPSLVSTHSAQRGLQGIPFISKVDWTCPCSWKNKAKNRVCGGGSSKHGCGKPSGLPQHSNNNNSRSHSQQPQPPSLLSLGPNSIGAILPNAAQPPSLINNSMDELRMIRESEQAAAQQMQQPNHQHRDRKRHRDNGKQKSNRRRIHNNVAPRMDCWFCVASPSCESHLIVSIGEHMYLTAPKGALSPGHMLIVPVSHDSR